MLVCARQDYRYRLESQEKVYYRQRYCIKTNLERRASYDDQVWRFPQSSGAALSEEKLEKEMVGLRGEGCLKGMRDEKRTRHVVDILCHVSDAFHHYRLLEIIRLKPRRRNFFNTRGGLGVYSRGIFYTMTVHNPYTRLVDL